MLITWFVVDEISHDFFLFNAELIVFDNAAYPLSISLSILEIFAVKFESCHKSYRFLHDFALQNFKGAMPPKVVRALTPQPRGASSAKVSSGYTP